MAVFNDFSAGRVFFIPSVSRIIKNIRTPSGYLSSTDKLSKCATLSFRLITGTTKEIAFR